MLTALQAAGIALAGLFVGVLINVVATRLAASRPMFGPLRCTRSPHNLSLTQALPVLGWALQRGQCSTCGRKISIAYPAVEVVTAVLLAGIFLIEGPGLAFLVHALYVAVLMLILVNDWRYRDIYLSVIAAGCVLALVGSVVLPEAGLVSALLGAAVAGAFFLLAYLAARLAFRHIEEPLGLGDVFLALLMGLMLGFPNIVGVLVIGPLIAGAVAVLLLVTGRSKMGDFMPYGVSLCAAAILFLLSPKPLGEALHLPALQIVFSGLLGTPN